jgi:hypothetical protein
MGLMKALKGNWPEPEHVVATLERAKAAWDADRASFVYRQSATSYLSEEGLNDALDGILDLGWQLHSTSLAYNQTGLNVEVALFVFVR